MNECKTTLGQNKNVSNNYIKKYTRIYPCKRGKGKVCSARIFILLDFWEGALYALKEDKSALFSISFKAEYSAKMKTLQNQNLYGKEHTVIKILTVTILEKYLKSENILLQNFERKCRVLQNYVLF